MVLLIITVHMVHEIIPSHRILSLLCTRCNVYLYKNDESPIMNISKNHPHVGDPMFWSSHIFSTKNWSQSLVIQQWLFTKVELPLSLIGWFSIGKLHRISHHFTAQPVDRSMGSMGSGAPDSHLALPGMLRHVGPGDPWDLRVFPFFRVWWLTYPVGMMTFPTEWGKVIIHSCSNPSTRAFYRWSRSSGLVVEFWISLQLWPFTSYNYL